MADDCGAGDVSTAIENIDKARRKNPARDAFSVLGEVPEDVSLLFRLESTSGE